MACVPSNITQNLPKHMAEIKQYIPQNKVNICYKPYSITHYGNLSGLKILNIHVGVLNTVQPRKNVDKRRKNTFGKRIWK